MDYMIYIGVYCMNYISQNLKFIITVVNRIEQKEKENKLEKSWLDSTPFNPKNLFKLYT